jgi:hypothetical protein
MRIPKVNTYSSGRIIGFLLRNSKSMFPAKFTQKRIILWLDKADLFEILLPNNQNVWNHTPEFIQPIESLYWA